jgi:hypothetical protein
MLQFFNEMKILQQQRSPRPGRKRILIVDDRDSGCRGQRGFGWGHEHVLVMADVTHPNHCAVDIQVIDTMKSIDAVYGSGRASGQYRQLPAVRA